MKKLFGLIAVLFVLTPVVMAQPKLPDPGITPDSPFYFLDRAFDRFQSSEAVADERASEIRAMAQKNNTRAMEVAAEGYREAMRNREREGNESAGKAEEVARQASNHLAILAQVRSKASQQARKGIATAMNQSARGRERALESLRKRNRERAREVANNTLQEVLSNAPEEARFGLQRALQAVNKKGPGGPANPQSPGEGPQEGKGQNSGKPENVTEGEKGQKPENVTGGSENPSGNVTEGEKPENQTSGGSNPSTNKTPEKPSNKA